MSLTKVNFNMASQAKKEEGNERYDVYEFRMLSATVVGAGSWKTCDFTNAELLRSNLSKFNNIPIYLNHETYDVRNAVGVVKDVYFEEEKEMEFGKVPAGINGKFYIYKTDGESEKISKLVEIGAIFSVSVGLEFAWQPSHTFDTPYGFYENIGDVVSGSLVRRVVTKISNVLECSLVHMGADPYAKQIVDGEMLQPDYSAMEVLEELGFDADKTKPLHLDEGSFKALIGTLKKDKKGVTLHQNKNDDNMEFKDVALKLGLSFVGDTLDADGFVSLAKGKISELSDSVTQLNNEVVELRKTKEELEPKAKLYEERVAFVKDEAEKIYRSVSLTKNLEPDETVIALIKSLNDEKSVQALCKTFGGDLSAQLSATCSKCGDTNVTLRSSEANESEDNKEEVVQSDDLLDFVKAINFNNNSIFKK